MQYRPTSKNSYGTKDSLIKPIAIKGKCAFFSVFLFFVFDAQKQQLSTHKRIRKVFQKHQKVIFVKMISATNRIVCKHFGKTGINCSKLT